MNYSRRQLYALGEAFGESATCAKAGGGRLYGGGGGGSSETNTTGATTTTTNTDRRVAAQDAVVVGDGGMFSSTSNTSTTFIDNSNSSDAVVAMANMGADVISSAGGAVVDLFESAGERNSDAWNSTITQGARLIDRLIDKAANENSLASKVVDAFTPTENKNTDAIKWAAIAAGVVGVAALWGKE